MQKDASYYRPISIIPVLARLLEKVAAGQLYEYCDARGIIPEQQFGFRKRSSCEMALIAAMESWRQSLDEGEMVGALLIDLSKAFDTVPHEMLLKEMSSIGCGGKALDWFEDYLTGRQQRVVQGRILTAWKAVTRGFPQGGGLSPLMFNVFVRKMPMLKTIQFADDITHSAASKYLEVILNELTEIFRKTELFCLEHGLRVNSSKTQLLILKSPARQIPEEFELILDGCHIRPEKTVKLLGVTLDQHLTFAQHIDGVVRKCHGLLSLLWRASRFLPRELLRMAYVAIVRSRIEYASALFAGAAKTHLEKMDRIQRMAARIVCGVPRQAHSAPLLEALNLQTLASRRTKHILDLVNSILQEECHPAFRDFFRVDGEGEIVVSHQAKKRVGARRFCFQGAEVFNKNVTR